METKHITHIHNILNIFVIFFLYNAIVSSDNVDEGVNPFKTEKRTLVKNFTLMCELKANDRMHYLNNILNSVLFVCGQMAFIINPRVYIVPYMRKIVT